MTRSLDSRRCIPISTVVLIAACMLLVGARGAQAARGPSPGAAGSSSGVSASIRAVQPAVGGLFQVHAPRAWADELDDSGRPGANGVPDFLDSWEAFRTSASSAILKNGYAFKTIDEQRQEILYAGVERAASKGVGSVRFEFNQNAFAETADGLQQSERAIGDLRIFVEIDAAGNVGTARFERYVGEGGKAGKFLPVVTVPGEGCNADGAACVVANGALLEVGYNSTILGKPEKDFAGVQITTDDSAGGTIRTMASLAGVSGGCVKEASNISNPVCTANDVRLAGVVSGSLVVAPGDGCNPNDPNDTVTLSFIGIYTAGPQRYDVGSFIATDGGGTDGARTGSCTRFAFANGQNGTSNFDGDSCGDIAANATLQIPVGPVTIKCSDAFHPDANGNPVAGGDGNIDFFHCETWANSTTEINCGSSADVRAGTPSKCGCGFLGAAAGFCVAEPDANLCDTEVCQGACQPASGSGGSGTTCTTNANCTVSGETCRNITVHHVPVSDGTSCGPAPTDVCGAQNTCQSGVCQTNFASASTVCRASSGPCDVPENCTGTSATCPADGFAPSTTVCRGSAGVCDVADYCNGTSASCPADVKSTAICRASAGICDTPESCDGIHNDCPADAFLPSSSVCRASAGACDPAETCTGSSASCPADAKSTSVCRAAAGVCDAAESCNGTSNDCPADVKLTSVCRPSAGVCDTPESCNGVNNDCPADAFLSSASVCRASAGVCDATENCTGSSAGCPPDVKLTSECRAKNGVCDIAENCNGVNDDCPADAIITADAHVVCRASDGSPCDPPEYCDGINKGCGADLCAGGERDPDVPKDICTPRT